MKLSYLRLLLLFCLVISGSLAGLLTNKQQSIMHAAQDGQDLRKQVAVNLKKNVQRLNTEQRDEIPFELPHRREIAPAQTGVCDHGCAININETKTGELTASDYNNLIGDGTYADVYTFTGTANQQIAIALSSADFDAYLYLTDASNNNTVITQDDDGGGGTQARIPANKGFFTLPASASGQYKIIVNALYASQTGGYQLSLASGLQFYPLPKPLRLVTTYAGTAVHNLGGQIPGNSSQSVQASGVAGQGVSIPAEAEVVVGNVTTTTLPNLEYSYLTLYASDESLPFVATAAYAPNERVNNAFTVRLGVDGKLNIYTYSASHVIIDITGYYAPISLDGLYFHPLPAPVRLLDTRGNGVSPNACNVNGSQPLTGGIDFLIQGNNACGIPAAAKALVGITTTVAPVGNGDLKVYPGDVVFPPLIISSVYLNGQTVSAPFITGLSASGTFKVYPYTTTHLAIDIVGYYSSDSTDVNGLGLLFSPLSTPVRLLETRVGQSSGCYLTAAPLPANSVRTQPAGSVCSIPATAQGIIGTATIVAPLSVGYFTLYPSSVANPPLVATAAFELGQTLSRHFVVGLGASDKAFKIYTYPTTDLVIDVSGYFAP